MPPASAPLIAAATAALTLALGAADVGATSVDVQFTRKGPGPNCDRTFAVRRDVRAPAVLRGAMAALLRGPSAAERARGYGGWFSRRTAGMLRSVAIGNGLARIDFKDLRKVIPNASTSCGSTLLLAQLNRTARQFPTVDHTVYSINGSRARFYNWLQMDVPRTAVDASVARHAAKSSSVVARFEMVRAQRQPPPGFQVALMATNGAPVP